MGKDQNCASLRLPDDQENAFKDRDPSHEEAHGSENKLSNEGREDRQDELSSFPEALQGLKIDLNEPWERSLLRSMKDSTTLKQEGKDSTHSNLLLLGHTESRDYALDMDREDNVSVVSSSSFAPLPFRKPSYRRASMGHCNIAALFDESYDETTIKTNSSMGSCKILRTVPISSSSWMAESTLDESRGEIEEKQKDESSSDRRPSSIRYFGGDRRNSISGPICKASAISESDLSGDSETSPSPELSYFCWGYYSPLTSVLSTVEVGSRRNSVASRLEKWDEEV